jgi:hypothetical protein
VQHQHGHNMLTCRGSNLTTAPSDLSNYSNAFSASHVNSSIPSQLYGAFSLKEQLTARSTASGTAHSPHQLQDFSPRLHSQQGHAHGGGTRPSDAPFHTPSYPVSAPASLDTTQFGYTQHPLPFPTHGSNAFDAPPCMTASPRSVLSSRSVPTQEQQEYDINRLTELESAAALGSAEAQYEIACMILEGRGVPRDVKFATAWFGYAGSFRMLCVAKQLLFKPVIANVI